MRVAVKGIGWVTSGGIGYGRNGDSFVSKHSSLPELTRKMIFDKPNRSFGRMDEYSRLGLAAVTFALKDAGLDKWEQKRNIGVIVSTVYGCLQTDIDYYQTVVPQGGILASPNLFAYTLPSSFLGEIALCFGLTGTSYSINEQTNTGLGAIKIAMENMACGDADTMIAGVNDLGCPKLLGEDVRVYPGAIFLVITKSDKGDRSEYGQLSLDKKGDVRLDDIIIGDIGRLVIKCLEHINNQKVD